MSGVALGPGVEGGVAVGGSEGGSTVGGTGVGGIGVGVGSGVGRRVGRGVGSGVGGGVTRGSGNPGSVAAVITCARFQLRSGPLGSADGTNDGITSDGTAAFCVP